MLQPTHLGHGRDGQGGGGEIFGRYRIRGVLGQGGMGRLYLAERMGIEGFVKVVALKRILPHLADSAQFRDMFLNEARVAARLEHPNIVATYELGEVNGTYFLSMEYLPGEDLAAILSRSPATRPMPLEIAAALAQQGANGLHYAHEMRDSSGRLAGLVHRDVNPLNIVVTYYGMVKLLDFGVVKGAYGAAKTVSGVFKGKYAYSAPEQINGGTVDCRTDVFCLGIVLWECLTGHRLFEGSTDVSKIDAVRSKKIDAPSALRPDVPRELDDIVLKCLARDPTLRYQTAYDMSEALDRFLLHREHRPTSKSIGLWLESVFGTERCSLKKAIAQGSEVESALGRLQATSLAFTGGPSGATDGSAATANQIGGVRPRTLWSTTLHKTASGSWPAVVEPGSSGAHPVGEVSNSGAISASLSVTPPPGVLHLPMTPPVTTEFAPLTPTGSHPRQVAPTTPRNPKAMMLLLGGVAAVATLAIVGYSIRAEVRRSAVLPSTPATTEMGVIDVRSEPAGAHVLADGNPTGLTTPTVLSGLPVGRKVEIRLDMPGWGPAVQLLEVRPRGQATPHSFKLTEASGRIRLSGVPNRASVLLDDEIVADVEQPIVAAVGRHHLRVDTASDLFFSEEIEVRPGEQTISVRKGKKGLGN